MEIRVIETNYALSPRCFLDRMDILNVREFLQIFKELVKVFIQSKDSIEVFDKVTLQKYLA